MTLKLWLRAALHLQIMKLTPIIAFGSFRGLFHQTSAEILSLFCILVLMKMMTNKIVVIGFLYHDHPPGMICMANVGKHAFSRVSQVYLCISQMYFLCVFLYHDHPLGMICMANAGEHAYGRVRAVWTAPS